MVIQYLFNFHLLFLQKRSWLDLPLKERGNLTFILRERYGENSVATCMGANSALEESCLLVYKSL
jgi:hypothetical protein